MAATNGRGGPRLDLNPAYMIGLQAPAMTGTGRVLSDTFYNSAGLSVRTHPSDYVSAAPSTALWTADETKVAPQTVLGYDGAERVITSTLHLLCSGRKTAMWR